MAILLLAGKYAPFFGKHRARWHFQGPLSSEPCESISLEMGGSL